MTPDLRACLDSALTPAVIDAADGKSWIVDTAEYYAAWREVIVAVLLPTLEAREQAWRAEREREDLRLAACMTAALGNTTRTVAERMTSDSPYWSASYECVCRAVNREMAHRQALADLRAQVTKLRSRLWMAIGRLDADPGVVAAYKVIIDQIDALLGDAPAPVATTQKEP